MKKFKFLIALGVSALLLSGCNRATTSDSNSSTSPSEDSGSGSSEVTPVTTDWTSEQKELLTTYCGEVLPFPEGFNGTIETVEGYDSNYYDLLEIYDTSSTFSIQNYYLDLVADGWTVIKGYNGNNYNGSKEDPLYMLTKTDSETGTGYYLQYYFYEGNVIDCYNIMTINETEDTSWGDYVASIKETLLTDLPFIKLGEDYDVYVVDDNNVSIYDTYTTSLISSYADELVKAGFTLDKTNSASSDYYVLFKDLGETVGTVEVLLTYYLGNYFQFSFDPVTTKSATWPSSVLSSIETKTGITIPSFEATSYEYYVKNGVVYITTETTTSIADVYEEKMEDTILLGSYGSYYNFEETLSLTFSDTGEYDEDYNFDIDGFYLKVENTVPTSSFSSTWPTEKINEYLTKEEITGRPLALSEFGSKDLKYYSYDASDHDALYEYLYSEYEFYIIYGIVTEKDIEQYVLDSYGFYIEIYDVNADVYDAYQKLYEDAGWFTVKLSDDVEEDDTVDAFCYEDITGTLSVYVQNSENVTVIQFAKGEGEAHTPKFAFSAEKYTISVGNSLSLKLIKEGYGGTVSFSCVSESGKISVNATTGVVTSSSEAEVGDSATITATLTTSTGEVKTATCKVEVVNEVVDKITPANFGIEEDDTVYANRDDYVSTDSGTTYKAYCAAGHKTIQIRSKTKGGYSGVVAQNASMTCSSISFTFNEATPSSKTIDIYASDEAFDIADMYGKTLTKIGSVTYDGENETVTFNLAELSESYSYIGFRSNDGALYLDSIEFKWC